MNRRKILKKILDGSKNIRFSDMTHVAEGFGFSLDRVNGSDHIFLHSGIRELVNLQNVGG